MDQTQDFENAQTMLNNSNRWECITEDYNYVIYNQTERTRILKYPSCSVEGCKKDNKTREYCNMHRSRLKRTGEIGIVGSTRDNLRKMCSIENCTKLSATKQDIFCSMHRKRFEKTGHTGNYKSLRTPRADKPECSVEGCSLISKTKNYCNMHYSRYYRTGETIQSKKRIPNGARSVDSVCKVENCTSKILAKDLCSKHYRLHKTINV